MKDDKNSDKNVIEYPNYLLQIQEAKISTNPGSESDLLLSVTTVDSSTKMINSVFHDLEKNFSDIDWHMSHAILSPRKNKLIALYEKMSKRFPGNFTCYKIADSIS